MKSNTKINWPDKKDFAFSIFDDTDFSTLENIGQVYSFLKDYGFRTTKSVWPIGGKDNIDGKGLTCENKTYLEWLLKLRNSGFEIAFHNASFNSSLRDRTINSLSKFNEYFGRYPLSMANHDVNLEGMYWGSGRINGINRFIYNLLTGFRYNNFFRGHIEGDDYFWGDLCKEKVKYVRNFVFRDINTFKACPIMPYHDSSKPYVNYWFASSEGSNIRSFNQCISEINQDKLEVEGGACIMYTHFAKGFYKNREIDSRFQSLMKRLSKKNGWFVPVNILLDYLLEKKGRHDITDKERKTLERKWLFHKLHVGST